MELCCGYDHQGATSLARKKGSLYPSVTTYAIRQKQADRPVKSDLGVGYLLDAMAYSQNIHEKSRPTDVYREIDILILGLSYMYTPSLRVTTIEPRRTLAFIAKCSRSWGRSGQVIESPICQRMRNKSL